MLLTACTRSRLDRVLPRRPPVVTLVDTTPISGGFFVRVGDIDSDGNSDVISLPVSAFLSVMFSDDAGEFDDDDRFVLAAPPRFHHDPAAIRSVDVTADGILDLVCSNTIDFNATQDFEPAFTAVIPGLGNAEFDVASMTIARPDDAPGDPSGPGALTIPMGWNVGQAIAGPEPEMTFIDTDSMTACVWPYPFSENALITTPLPSPLRAVGPVRVNPITSDVLHIADVSGDGFDDIVYMERDHPRRVRVMLSDAAGGFIDADAYAVSETIFSKFQLLDFNSDGALDIVQLGFRHNEDETGFYYRAAVRLNNGAGAFGTAQRSVIVETTSSNEDDRFGSFHDIDNDGCLDALYLLGDQLHVLRGAPNGSLAAPVAFCFDTDAIAPITSPTPMRYELTHNQLTHARRFAAKFKRAGSHQIDHYVIEVAPLDFGCPADLDASRVIDSTDLATLLAAWGTNNPAADLDGSGLVDAADVAILLAAWGDC